TFMVSVSSSGKPGNGPSHSARGVSPDGRYVTFESLSTNLASGDTNGAYDVFLRDRKAGKTYLISRSSAGQEGNGGSADPVVSANGRFVAYESEATNLVSPDANGAMADV